MLDSLDAIDWSQLSHAYGPARDVPGLIRDLTSPESETRESALSDLYSNIWHQGTVYQATSLAVPFLIEVLETSPCADRAGILHLLHTIAGGSSYLGAHQHLDGYHNKRHTPEFKAELERELGHVRAARAAVVVGVPKYLHLLSDSEPAIRTTVPYLLAECTERATDIEQALRNRLGTEANADAKASMILALGKLWQSSRQVEEAAGHEALLVRLMNDAGESAQVRMSAALCRIQLGGTKPFPEIVPVLYQAILDCAEPSAQSPWYQDSTLYTVIDYLRGQPNLCLMLVRELLPDAKLKLRVEIIWTMEAVCRKARSMPDKLAPVLGELLGDSEVEVRERAASALSCVGSAARHAVQPLLRALSDESPRVCNYAAIALAKLSEERAWPGIEHLLDQGDTFHTALRAIKALGPATRSAIPKLREVLRRGGDGQLMLAVAQALASIGPEAREALPEMINALGQPDAAGGVAWALAILGESAKEAVPELITLLSAGDTLARRNSAKALGRIGPAARTATTVIKSCLGDSDASVRAQAAFSLWQIEGSVDGPVSALMEVIRRNRESTKYDDQYACSSAAKFLGLIGTPAKPAVPLLRELLSHDSHWVRVHSACSLWQIERNAEGLLSTLIQELICRPAGMEVLRCLADMGPDAQPGLPRLKEIINSETRSIESGALDTWIDEDEAFGQRQSGLLSA